MKKETITAIEHHSEAVSPIMNVVHDRGNMILQGAELGRGWTLLINEATGEMSVTVAEPDGAFVLFGACKVQ